MPWPNMSQAFWATARVGIAAWFNFKTVLFSHDLAHHRPIPGAGVKLDQNDLLPGPQGHLPPYDGHGQRGTQEGGSYMRVTVIVMPGLFVLIAGRLGGKPLEPRLEVVIDETGLEFRRGNPRRGAHVEERDSATCDAGF